jgi:ribosomal protein S6
LTNIVKTISNKVVTNGGIVRSIQNHGIRQLPHRFKAKYPDREGNRYYEKGRFMSVYYDASPDVLKEVNTFLKLEEQVLRNTHLKARNKLWYVNIAREDKNPYIQKVAEMEAEAEEAAMAQSEQQH